MWTMLAKFVLKNKVVLLILLLLSTLLMGYYASKIKLSYEFAKAIPTDNPKYKDYQDFKATFGDDGNTMVIGVVQKDLFSLKNFIAYRQLHKDIRTVKSVEDVLSVTSAITLLKDSLGERLIASKVFPETILSQYPILSQYQLDSAKAEFLNLPFYRGLMYNPATNAYLMAVRINKDVLASKERSIVIENISKLANAFKTGQCVWRKNQQYDSFKRPTIN